MSDRELLEAAARAARIDLRECIWHEDQTVFVSLLPRTPNWNPLTDDGDAFRLAVKLEITATSGKGKCTASWWVRPAMIELDDVAELTGDDPYAATRRAIVRAAAALAPPGDVVSPSQERK